MRERAAQGDTSASFSSFRRPARCVERHWQQELAAKPALRAELDAAVATYTRWLRGLPG